MKKANKSQTEVSKYFCARRFSGGRTKVIALVGILAISGALQGIYGLQLSSEQIDALAFTEEQTTKASTIMAHPSAFCLCHERRTVGFAR